MKLGGPSVLNHFLRVLTLAFIGLFWWALFPVISISTGELKARSIFVDENAFLINSLGGKSNHHSFNHLSIQNIKFDDICNHSITLHSSCHYDFIDDVEITEILVEPSNRQSSKESTIFIFPIPGHALESLVVQITYDLIQRIQAADWLARNVVILVFRHRSFVDSGRPGRNYMFSRPLKHWLSSHLELDPANILSLLRPSTGLLRQAFVLDFSDYSSDSKGNWPTGHVQLQSVGYNGDLPNMDLLAVALALAPAETVTECGSASSNFGSSGGAWQVYQSRMLGLYRFVTALVWGANGLHGHFLSNDIDALTLKLVVDHNTIGSSSKQSQGRQKADFRTDVLNLLEGLLHATSNLHEELHHSFTQYLLLDTAHFLALPEYGPSLLLVAAPLFWLFHEGYGHPEQGVLSHIILESSFCVVDDAVVSLAAVAGSILLRFWLLRIESLRFSESEVTWLCAAAFVAVFLVHAALVFWCHPSAHSKEYPGQSTCEIAVCKVRRSEMVVYQRQLTGFLIVLLAMVSARHFALGFLLTVITTTVASLCSVHVYSPLTAAASDEEDAAEKTGDKGNGRAWVQLVLAMLISPAVLLFPLLRRNGSYSSTAAVALVSMDEGASILPPTLLLFSYLLSLGAVRAAASSLISSNNCVSMDPLSWRGGLWGTSPRGTDKRDWCL